MDGVPNAKKDSMAKTWPKDRLIKCIEIPSKSTSRKYPRTGSEEQETANDLSRAEKKHRQDKLPFGHESSQAAALWTSEKLYQFRLESWAAP
jgi:hypothetical protein